MGYLVTFAALPRAVLFLPLLSWVGAERSAPVVLLVCGIILGAGARWVGLKKILCVALLLATIVLIVMSGAGAELLLGLYVGTYITVWLHGSCVPRACSAYKGIIRGIVFIFKCACYFLSSNPHTIDQEKTPSKTLTLTTDPIIQTILVRYDTRHPPSPLFGVAG